MEKELIQYLFIASTVALFLPLVYWLVRWLARNPLNQMYRASGLSNVLKFSACLMAAVWFLRFAVGRYISVAPQEGDVVLEFWEEAANSIVHTLQTFSMDEDYTYYIDRGKDMMSWVYGQDSVWIQVYSVYASVLNVVAPIAGGAIVFEMLASIFPAIRLWLSYGRFWQEKYFFSELNEASLALARSACKTNALPFTRPVMIFTDAYADDEVEKSAERLMEAKRLGAICVRDDLAHVRKNRMGKRTFFLCDQKEAENLHTLADLVNSGNAKFLRKAIICLFTNEDAYVQVESRICEKLGKNWKKEDIPVLIPVQSDRNMVCNLLHQVPLFEPLVGKAKKDGQPQNLTVAILGGGRVGQEMFLTTYWIGQMLDCNLTIKIRSAETEEVFWSKIDSINPEIRESTKEYNDILLVNAHKKEMKERYAAQYCEVEYIPCDLKSSAFLNELEAGEQSILDADYFMVALGNDEDNISVANAIRRALGIERLRSDVRARKVITYVVYDSDLAELLNEKKLFGVHDGEPDVYMRAVGSLREVYSMSNVFMVEYDALANQLDDDYRAQMGEAVRSHRNRRNNDYKHWANLARAMHQKYRMYSMGVIDTSIFDYPDNPDNRGLPKEYVQALEGALLEYNAILKRNPMTEEDKALLNRMAWLEHRRWNAFTRIKGFRQTADYSRYAKALENYRHWELKLHPCLVECDQSGMRPNTLECGTGEDYDQLDELSYQLYTQKLNGYDFKTFDTPAPCEKK